MNPLYVLDASGYVYRNYFAIKNMTNAKGESTNALFGFIRSLFKLIKDFHPTHLVAVFDGPRNAQKRLQIYPEYKAHRLEMPKDLRYQIDWARQFCTLMGIPMLNIAEVEADDVMGSIAIWAEKMGSTVYLCTSDKDMCQVVSDKILILNTSKDNQVIDADEVKKIHGVPPNKMVEFLAMVGDSSDNVPGLPGFGPKTAADLLNSLGSLDYILSHPNEVPGKKKQDTIIQDKEKALISKRLVTIDTEVDFPKDPAFFSLKSPHSKEELLEFFSSMNFNSLIKELEQQPSVNTAPKVEEEVYYLLVDDVEALDVLLKKLSQEKEICFSTLTLPQHPLVAELVGIGISIEAKKAWYIPTNGNLRLEKVIQSFKPLFENPHIGFYGHNVKRDYHVLSHYGIKIKKVSFDTILASYVLNSHLRQHSLDTLTLETFGKVKILKSDLTGKGKKVISLKDVPLLTVMQYACEDVDYIGRLKTVLQDKLKERNLEKLLYSLELPLMLILAEMEQHGIYLDVLKLKNMSSEIQIEIGKLDLEIIQMAGVEFNISSPLQLKKILFETLKIPYPKKRSKDISTGEEILELLNEYPITQKILSYRRLEKLRSTYLDVLPLQVNPKTERIHCTFNQSVAATGRLSCQEPNLQNIPVRTEIGRTLREAFKPQKKGWSYLAADYSQIELRLLAHLSEDPVLIEAFTQKEDIHTFTAAAIYNIPIHEVTKEMRYQAKAVNFGLIYGQQAFGLSQTIHISTSEASLFIEKYFERFKKVRPYLETCKEKARKEGRAVTYTGRERLIPEIHNKNGLIRSQAERLAVNTPFQGTAADLIKMAMLAVDKSLKVHRKLGFMILQIHDELIFEVPDFELIDFEPIVRQSMENVFKLKVPIVVDISIGKNWKEC